MNRRVFLCGLTLGTLVARLAGEAQPVGKVPRIGVLGAASPEWAPHTDALRQGLRELGYVEGQNITSEWRWARGHDLQEDLRREVADSKEPAVTYLCDVRGSNLVATVIRSSSPSRTTSDKATHARTLRGRASLGRVPCRQGLANRPSWGARLLNRRSSHVDRRLYQKRLGWL
jgi:hypothetical protein